MSGVIEAIFIFDEHFRPILSHTYTSRPLSAAQICPHYLAYQTPRPNLIYLPNTSPQTLVFSLVHSNLLFLATTSTEIEPLLALEFLHRTIDVFEDFLSAPLLAHKIENNHDVVAQLLNEMCDAGAVSTTEPNALRDLVEVEGLIGKLLGGINIPGKPGFPPSLNQGVSGSAGSLSPNTPALPWRRANVRHTSNELYVDMVETLSIIMAPSGRPLSAFAYGTIAFTSKLSGVPDLVLNLSTPSGRQNISSVVELPVFHPCVRLAKWRERPGELSFIPPDGRFVLAGYEVNLLSVTDGKISASNSSNLNLPVKFEVNTNLGPTGSDFEIRLSIVKVSGPGGTSSTAARGNPLGRNSAGFGGGIGGNLGSSATPVLEDLVVTVPLPSEVRNLLDIRASRGETTYNPGEKNLEWHIPAKDAVVGGATLRCAVVGPLSIKDESETEANGFHPDDRNDYDEEGYQSTPVKAPKVTNTMGDEQFDAKQIAQNKFLMPTSAAVSFTVKGWLPSGLKVDSLVVDTKKTRGLAEGIKPYKGVKYLTISTGGVELRC